MGTGREKMADEDMQYQIRRVSFLLSVYLPPSTKIHFPRNVKNCRRLKKKSFISFSKKTLLSCKFFETQSFQGISQLWPCLPGKAINLFFSPSPKTPSLRFNLVSGGRSQIQLQDFWCIILYALVSSVNGNNTDY